MRVRLKHERLARELARSGRSQNRWAQVLGLTSGHLSQLANGKRPYPSAATRDKLLKGLGLKFEDLFQVDTRPEKSRSRADSVHRTLKSTPFRSRSAPRAFPPSAASKGRSMVNLKQDVFYALRSLKRSPSFALVAMLTLALGIGANTAIFSVVDSVLLSPLPYPQPDRLVRIWQAFPSRGSSTGPVSPHNLDDWREMSQSFQDMGGYPNVSLTGMVLSGDGEPQEIAVTYVTDGFFSTLGVNALEGGRTLQPDDHIEGSNRKIVLSYGLWQSRFGGDSAIVGESLTLSGTPFEIVGIMPRSFEFPSGGPRLWAPISLIPDSGVPRRRGIRWLNVIARLKPGVTLEQAGHEMNQVALSLSQQYPADNEGLTETTLQGLQQHMVKDARIAILVVLGAVGFVLLIACANVANLSLARSESRRRELAVRMAMGAGRRRIVSQVLTESVILGTMGGILGLLLAALGVRLLLGLAPTDIAGLADGRLDERVLLFTLTVALISGIGFGLAPAWRTSGLSLQDSLREGGRNPSAAVGRQVYRRSLVIGQVAMVAVLAIAAGLLVGSYQRLLAVDPGFRPDGVYAFRINCPGYKYPDIESIRGFFRQVREQVGQLPQVREASIIRPLPLGVDTLADSFSGEGWTYWTTPEERDDSSRRPTASARFVSPGYFRTMGIPLLSGVDFQDRDTSLSVIVNQTLAEARWPGEDAVGKQMGFGDSPATVIAVAGNVQHLGLSREPRPAFYVSTQLVTRRGMTLAVHSQSNPLELIPAVQQAIWQVDPDQPVTEIASMELLVSQSVNRERFSMLLLTLFASLGLVLAGVGIYGTLSYLVNRRRHEIGVRISLGAGASQVLRLVVGQGMVLSFTGLILGVLAALGLTRFMNSMLFGVSALDPATFVAVAAILAIASFAACYFPARRASRVDPVQALRSD